MRCSELRGASRAGRRAASAWRLRCSALRRRRPGAQVERLLPAARRPAGRARGALGHRPARPRRRPRSRRRRRRQAHLGRGPHRLAAHRGLCDWRASRSTAARFEPASAASSGAATAPMRCCTSPRPAPCRRRRRSATRSSPRSIRPTAASPRSSVPAQPVALSVLDPARAGGRRAAAGSAASAASGSAAAREPPSRWQFLEEGIRHILGGYDHVLFLLCLLLPAVMRRTGRALATGRAPVRRRSGRWPASSPRSRSRTRSPWRWPR